jgi:hypothetical protein
MIVLYEEFSNSTYRYSTYGIFHKGLSVFSVRSSRPTWGTTSLRNCAPLPQAQSMGYPIGKGLVPNHALPPAHITNRYMHFILRERGRQLQRPGAGWHRSRVWRNCIVGTPAGGQGSKA